MELTFDHFIYFLGIFLGVGLTLLGVGFTEYFRNRKEKIRLTTAFKNELLDNLNKAMFNLKVLEDTNVLHHGARHSFYTVAYEQLKLNILLDWTNSEFASKIHDGFSFAMEYNKRISNPKLFEIEMGSEKVILENIRDCMLYTDKFLKGISNIEKITN
jgi:hypothetical protein